MPIKRERFDAETFKTKKKNTKKKNTKEHPVIVILSSHESLAYTAKEICKLTKMKDATVRSKLRDMSKKGLIEHKAPYFAWKKVSKKKANKTKKKK